MTTSTSAQVASPSPSATSAARPRPLPFTLHSPAASSVRSHRNLSPVQYLTPYHHPMNLQEHLRPNWLFQLQQSLHSQNNCLQLFQLQCLPSLTTELLITVGITPIMRLPFQLHSHTITSSIMPTINTKPQNQLPRPAALSPTPTTPQCKHASNKHWHCRTNNSP